MFKDRNLFKSGYMRQAVVFTIILLSLFVFAACSAPPVENTEKVVIEDSISAHEEVQISDPFEGYRLIEVDGDDQSGHREANVVVNVGFGDREYWAYTNEHGQLIKVTAAEIILQLSHPTG